MPCYDSGPRDGVSYSDFDEVKKKLDLVTHLLCELTKELKLEDIKNPDIKAWVEDHRQRDEIRKNLKKKTPVQSLNEHFKDTYKGKL